MSETTIRNPRVHAIRRLASARRLLRVDASGELSARNLSVAIIETEAALAHMRLLDLDGSARKLVELWYASGGKAER